MATLAPNLARRRADVKAVYPALTVYWLGDPAHQAEQSDHNPDAAGVVHAIDIMAAAGTAPAAVILRWLLAWPNDLQYVIHNRRIWGVDNGGWGGDGQAYHGDNPHTDHIHVSGRHGSAHRNAATGTGYDLAAEQMTPPTLEDYMTTPDDVLDRMAVRLGDPNDPLTKIMRAIPWQYNGHGFQVPGWTAPEPPSTLAALNAAAHAVVAQFDPALIAAAVVAQLPAGQTVDAAALETAAETGAQKAIAAALDAAAAATS